ncbi:sugar transferase [Ruminiclostridium josui]|uniref:sugar transferase n=1 Tax=Ruminiclostridium josui TaxID=1499 RepID=UPI00046484D0|nr:sugar transferase [Ruminiclostridium josui]
MNILQNKIKEVVDEGALYTNKNYLYVIEKRVFDIVISSIALIVLFPLFIVISFAIKVDSPGPAIFKQERMGFRGKIFNMYKFRTMVNNAEQLLEEVQQRNQMSGHMFKIKDDPRITKLGRVLRKTSIDELPQLVNVIKGEMSLVGPRPPLIREVEKYDIWHHLRMSIKPGLTGIWQISGRNKLGFDGMIRLDLKYIRERNFWYDLKIIIKTMPVLLGDRNAF